MPNGRTDGASLCYGLVSSINPLQLSEKVTVVIARRPLQSQYNSRMRLEHVGAALIVSAIILFKIAYWRVTCPLHSWCNVYLPFVGFLIMALGALLGVIGMIALRVQKQRERHS
jgi:hypothetical protein